MSIKAGDRIPNGTLKHKTSDGVTDISTEQLFSGKKVVVFAVPGAFTPTCSAKHLPGFIAKAAEIRAKGVDTIACVSVNDAFVMNAWAKEHEIEKVKMIPDGSGEFTRDMDMIVFKPAQNFGLRSWRYAMIVNDMEIEQMIVEPGKNQQGLDDDPYEETKPEHILLKL